METQDLLQERQDAKSARARRLNRRKQEGNERKVRTDTRELCKDVLYDDFEGRCTQEGFDSHLNLIRSANLMAKGNEELKKVIVQHLFLNRCYKFSPFKRAVGEEEITFYPVSCDKDGESLCKAFGIGKDGRKYVCKGENMEVEEVNDFGDLEY